MKLYIYGAGGFAKELYLYINDYECQNSVGKLYVSGFISDVREEHDQYIDFLQIHNLESITTKNPVFLIGIGNSYTREKIANKLSNAKFGIFYQNIVFTAAEIRSVAHHIQPGTVICPGSILTYNVSCDKHVQINLNCTVGHDCVLDDYVTLSPGVHVSGHCKLGRHTFVGTGSVICPGVTIAPHTYIYAGSCVTKDITQPGQYAGSPVRLIKPYQPITS